MQQEKSPISFPIQFLIGASISLVVLSIIVPIGLFHVSLGPVHWVAFFMIVWLGLVAALRREMRGIVLGLLTGCFAGYLLLIFIVHGNH